MRVKMLGVFVLTLILISAFAVAQDEKKYLDSLNKFFDTVEQGQPAGETPPATPTTTPPTTPPAAPTLPAITQIGDVKIGPDGVPEGGAEVKFEPTMDSFTVTYNSIANAKFVTLELWALGADDLEYFTDPNLSAEARKKWKNDNRSTLQFYLANPGSPPVNNTFNIVPSSIGGLPSFYNKNSAQLYLVVENCDKGTAAACNSPYTWQDSLPVRLNWTDSCKKCDTILWCKACMDLKLVKSVFK
ncbi:hypothetical protein KKH30_02385 [Candidatus Micrarchaeota archaeon]|nr:hypothetical protein [Candidatus Micrarchaeota archaeon]